MDKLLKKYVKDRPLQAMVVGAGVVALGAFVFFGVFGGLPQASISDTQATTTPERAEESVGAPGEAVFITDQELEQGDTFGIAVSFGTSTEISFEERTVPIARIGEAHVAFVGIDAKAVPRPRTLAIAGTNYTVSVLKRDFPVTKLVLSDTLEEQGVTTGELTQNIAQNDQKSLEEVLAVRTPQAHYTGAFREPLSQWRDVGGFGNVRQSATGAIRHLGVDLDAKRGDAVFASQAGRVVLSRTLPNFGESVVVDHGHGIMTLYLHLEKRRVAAGEMVGAGDVLGTVGSSGAYSLSPHLHFSVKIRGASVDPRRFIDTTGRLFETLE